MAAATKIIGAGNKYHFLGFLDSFGYLTGGNSSAPASGAAGSGMYRIVGVKSAAPTIPESDVVQATGDDDLLVEFQFQSIATRRFTVDVAVHDQTLVSRLQNTLIETVGEIAFGAFDILDAPEYDVSLILQSRHKKFDDATKGKKAWGGYLIPLANAQALGRVAFTEREVAVFRYSITPQIASYMPWGVTIAEANVGTTGLRYRDFSTDYPITMHRHTGNGALSTFTLDLEPISAAKTKSYERRVAKTTSSVVTTSPFSTTLSAIPADGSELVTVYEFNG